MDAGYIVVAVFLALIGISIWTQRGRWNGKRNRYTHNPMPGHRQEGSSGGADPGGD
ncbi:hypothetical protein RUE5091_03915 [Ruegeria denitrificans]|uniref:Uncharacterized protein n=1 Tax=Ruegeria denitrificans TaxID=1715692 RepID=A0A0P1IJ29_9RHOB|nr:hypothetical protein RUE5091_03915 [Ruegeria denitrificans]